MVCVLDVPRQVKKKKDKEVHSFFLVMCRSAGSRVFESTPLSEWYEPTCISEELLY